MRRKAFSYMRFSSPKQAEKDSLRRQKEGRDKFCQRRSLELDRRGVEMPPQEWSGKKCRFVRKSGGSSARNGIRTSPGRMPSRPWAAKKTPTTTPPSTTTQVGYFSGRKARTKGACCPGKTRGGVTSPSKWQQRDWASTPCFPAENSVLAM